MKTYRLLLFCLLWLGISISGLSQHLKRRPFLGVQLMPVSDSLAKINKRISTEGALVVRVIPNSTAAQLKLQPNDIVLQINKKPTKTVTEVVTAARAFKTGEVVNVQLARKGKIINLKGKVQPMPYETSATADVLYDEVALENNNYARSILKKPKGNGIYPVVFFIQGYNCGSLDNLPEKDAQRQLIDGLVAKGYAVFRMDKPGVGDGINTKPCSEIGYNEELAAFAAGLKKLKQYDFLDTANIFLFGHSLGANTAPIIASKNKVKGIITYGAAGKPWAEYLLEVFREQRPISGVDYVQVDQDMKTLLPLVYELMILKKMPQELAANPKYRPFLENNLDYDGNGHLFGRHYTVLQELQEIPVNQAWRDAAAYTLAIYGEADVPAIDADGTKMIAEVVNSYFPGKATFEFLPRTDHGFIEVGTKQDYRRLVDSGEYDIFAQKNFNHKLVDLIDIWMKDKRAKA